MYNSYIRIMQLHQCCTIGKIVGGSATGANGVIRTSASGSSKT